MPTLTQADLQSLADRINQSIEDYSIKTLTDEPRTHLGMSEIGDPCSRKLWYKFRWTSFETFDGRMMRLFKRGHREENRFISYLVGIGCQVFQYDDNGKQFRASGCLGHYGGSCDGQLITPWYDDRLLVEFKTHNTKSFSNYADKGLIKSKPMHKDQMDSYGWKFGLEYGLYFPENKNDDDIKTCVVKLDHQRGMQLERKAEEIIFTKEPPPRISDNPAMFNCSYCHWKPICHDGAVPAKNCRSCRMSEPVADAQWKCNRYGQNIPANFIKDGCSEWVPL